MRRLLLLLALCQLTLCAVHKIGVGTTWSKRDRMMKEGTWADYLKRKEASRVPPSAKGYPIKANDYDDMEYERTGYLACESVRSIAIEMEILRDICIARSFASQNHFQAFRFLTKTRIESTVNGGARASKSIMITYRRSRFSTSAMFPTRHHLPSLTYPLRNLAFTGDNSDTTENSPFPELREVCLNGTLTSEAFISFARDKPVEHRFQISTSGALEWTQIVHDLYPRRQGTLNLPRHTVAISHLTAEKLKTDPALPPGPIHSLFIENYSEASPEPSLQLIFNIIIHLPLLPTATVIRYRTGNGRFASKISAWTNYWIAELPPKMSVYRSEEVTRVELDVPNIDRLQQLVSRLLCVEYRGILLSMNRGPWTDLEEVSNHLRMAVRSCGISCVPLYGFRFCLLDGKVVYHNKVDAVHYGSPLIL